MNDCNLTLLPGDRWMLLTNNGKLIVRANRQFWSEDPSFEFWFASKADMIEDISISLQGQKRCAGRMEWDIGRHSILVSRLMTEFFSQHEFGALAGLAHDWHEAYTSDICSPVGAGIAGLTGTKERVQWAIFEFLDWDVPEYKEEVHFCDQLAWELESAKMLRFHQHDPFLQKHAPDLVERKFRKWSDSLHRASSVFNTIRSHDTVEFEFERLTKHGSKP